jgi:hypothetical protein
MTFDGENKLIIIDYGVTTVDVLSDVYSRWKDWCIIEDNIKFLPALRTIGGDPTTGSNSVAPYFFLTNGWRIRPFEGDHTLLVTGNLYVDGGGNPFVHTIGDYNVSITLMLSNNAVTVATGGSALTTDEHNKLYALPTILDILTGVFEKDIDGRTFESILEMIAAYTSGKIVKSGNNYSYYRKDNQTLLFTLVKDGNVRTRSDV